MTNTKSTERPFRLASAEQMKAAWRLRRELAVKYSVRIKFVHLGDCICEVSGRSRGVIRDCFGNQLGYDRSRINYFLLTESAIVIDIAEVAAAVGRATRYVGNQFAKLIRKGFLCDHHGWVYVELKKRPFQPAMG